MEGQSTHPLRFLVGEWQEEITMLLGCFRRDIPYDSIWWLALASCMSRLTESQSWEDYSLA
jgi:hypothetical protein